MTVASLQGREYASMDSALIVEPFEDVTGVEPPGVESQRQRDRSGCAIRRRLLSSSRSRPIVLPVTRIDHLSRCAPHDVEPGSPTGARRNWFQTGPRPDPSRRGGDAPGPRLEGTVGAA